MKVNSDRPTEPPQGILVLATGNKHKAEEIQAILGPGFRYLTLRDLPDPPAVVEDAPTFVGNALKKAVTLANWIVGRRENIPALSTEHLIQKSFVLADDSGLEVEALNGAPGVHSARFAADDPVRMANSPDAANNAKLLRLLATVPEEQRTARFRCVLAVTPLPASTVPVSSSVCFADEAELGTRIFEGTCEGRIGYASRGENGFGYDPLFVPSGFDKTFAELGSRTKDQISHRSKALANLVAGLR